MQTSAIELPADLSDDAAQYRASRRWLIVLMLFAAAVLNYIDRSILGIVAPEMQKQLGISDTKYAAIADAFLVAYTVSYLFSGRLIDRIGSRLIMIVFVGFWSIANALTGAARSLFSLGLFRFLLGLGEAGGYTGSPKAVSEWFAPRERGIAIGIYSLGASLGATLAPMIVACTASTLGWRGAFVVTGAMGLLWLLPWFWIARPLARPAAPAGTDAEPKDSQSAVAPAPAGKLTERQLWAWMLRQGAVWRLTLARLLTDAVWYFYIFWMPKYLASAWGVTQQGMGVMVYVFLAADVGFVGGGFLSGWLVRRRVAPATSRLWVMAMAAALVPLSVIVPHAGALHLVILLAAVIAMAHCVWLGNISTLIVDLMPADRLATTFGLIAAGSAAGGVAMNTLVAWAIGHYSYAIVFYVMAALHPIALLIVWPVRRAKLQ
ncbi:MAG: MFS transporter [Tepidisphaeraceae bacterium]